MLSFWSPVVVACLLSVLNKAADGATKLYTLVCQLCLHLKWVKLCVLFLLSPITCWVISVFPVAFGGSSGMRIMIPKITSTVSRFRVWAWVVSSQVVSLVTALNSGFNVVFRIWLVPLRRRFLQLLLHAVCSRTALGTVRVTTMWIQLGSR